jgi:hypothetical protein
MAIEENWRLQVAVINQILPFVGNLNGKINEILSFFWGLGWGDESWVVIIWNYEFMIYLCDDVRRCMPIGWGNHLPSVILLPIASQQIFLHHQRSCPECLRIFKDSLRFPADFLNFWASKSKSLGQQLIKSYKVV